MWLQDWLNKNEKDFEEIKWKAISNLNSLNDKGDTYTIYLLKEEQRNLYGMMIRMNIIYWWNKNEIGIVS